MYGIIFSIFSIAISLIGFQKPHILSSSYALKQKDLTYNDFSEALSFNGRYRTDGQNYFFDYSNSGFDITFIGSYLECSYSVITSNDSYPAYLTVAIDGQKLNDANYISLTGKMDDFTLVSGLKYAKHKISIRKRSSIFYSSFGVSGFKTDGDFYSREEPKDIKLEFYGDGITAGDYIECKKDIASFDLSKQNSQKTYASICSEELDANCSLVCASYVAVSKAIMDHPGYDKVSDFMNLSGFDPENPDTHHIWNNNNPDVIVVNLGQTDSIYANRLKRDGNSDDYTSFISTFESDFHQLIFKIISDNPKSNIIISCGMVSLNDDIKKVMKDAYDQASINNKIFYLEYSSQNVAGIMPNNNPNIAQNEYAAKELKNLICEILGIKNISNSKAIETIISLACVFSCAVVFPIVIYKWDSISIIFQKFYRRLKRI